ncbi:MAG: hypothetical protein NVSMB64_06780 [Candidatus Velthaea sp.]
MNLFIPALNPAQAGTTTKTPALPGTKPLGSAPIDIGLFRAQLAARVQAPGSSAKAGFSDQTRLDALEKKILDQLQAGVSVQDISARLAATLASSVATQLGISAASAQARLRSAFQSALSPPGQTGPPGTTADQARSLAQRFAQVANIATRVANGESRQLNRLVGNILDAKSAKDTPAPAPTTPPSAGPDLDSRDASDNDAVTRALAAFQQATQLTVPTPTLAAPAVSDGKSVKLAPAQAIATGGTTLLGRVLSRAIQAAENRETAPAVVETGSAKLAIKPLQPAVTSFLESFDTAFATRAAKNEIADTPTDDGTFAGLLSSTDGTSNASAFVPVAPPFTIDSSQSITASAPATPLHPAAVDTSAIVDQVLRGVFARNLGQSNEIRLRLVPEHLGDVTIKLNVSAAGSVIAHVIAQSADVRDALVAGQSQLTKSLADAGLKLTGFSVDVNNGFANFTQQHGGSQQRPSGGRRTLRAGIDADEGVDDLALSAVPSFGPPLLANRDFGKLNYLV